jgi:hypothetical protein
MGALLPLAFGTVFAALAAPTALLLLAGGQGAEPALLRLAGLGALALGTAAWLAVRRMPLPPRAVLPVLLAELALIAGALALLVWYGPTLTPPGQAVVIGGLALAATVVVSEARP